MTKIYLDINQFGTPHWLGPLARIDPMTIREYNRQQWLEAQRAKRAATNAKYGLDAGFDPSQERDYRGRWAKVGSGGSKIKPFMKKDLRRIADEVADDLGFPKEKIFISDKEHYLDINGQKFNSSAIAIDEDEFHIGIDTYYKGDIVLFFDMLKNDPDVSGAVAHEIMHQKFAPVLDKADKELKEVAADVGESLFGENNDFNPAYKRELPTAWKLYELGVYGSKGEDLINNDGVSEYSRLYWENFETNSSRANFTLAVHETLAEMSRLRYTGQHDPSTDSEIWSDLFDTVNAEYKKLSKRRKTTDANPYHEPAGSPKGGQFARAPGAKEAWIREKIDKTAEQLNFPKERIHLSTGKYLFELNGVTHRAGGLAIYNPNGYTQEDTGERFGLGDIILFDWKDTGFNEDLPITGVAAHEIEHQKFRQVMARYDEELAALDKRYGRDGLVDRGNTADRGMVMPRPDLEKEFPTLTAIGKTDWLSVDTGKKLRETDGVTDYSREYWTALANGTTTYSNAVNETLAEIANLDVMGELKNPPTHISYDEVENFIVEDIRRDPGYTDEERKRAKQDPWEYADAVNRDRFLSRFGVKFDELDFDSIRRTVVLPDFSESTLYKTLSPEWKTLYDTIEQEYRRINGIKS